eukprot:PhF_6_TR9213/c3_g1_i1/m.14462
MQVSVIQAPTPLTPPLSSVQPVLPRVSELKEKSNRVCRHFARGRCTWGNDCRFTHAFVPPTVTQGVPTKMTSQITQPLQQVSQQQQLGETQQPVWLGLQQQALLEQRSTVLMGALTHRYHYDSARGVVCLPDGIEVHVGPVEAKRNTKTNDAQCLLALIGEPADFWRAIVSWSLFGTSGSEKLDVELHRVSQCGVQGATCMFHSAYPNRCVIPNCIMYHPTDASIVLPPLLRPVTQSAPFQPRTNHGEMTSSLYPASTTQVGEDDDDILEFAVMGGMKWDDMESVW